MANLKFILWEHQKNSDDTYSIRLRITRQRKIKYISFGLSATEKQWDKDAQRYKKDKRLTPDHDKFNLLLNEYENRANDIISEFEKLQIDWTLNQFEDRFVNRAKQGKIEIYFHKVIQQLKETGHTGNSNAYSRTLHMLQLFDKKFSERKFHEIDIKYVNNFNIWLQKPRTSIGKGNKKIDRDGCDISTRRYYMKTLRALLNKAIQEKEASKSTYPFGKGGFELAKLNKITEKRYLPKEYREKMKNSLGKSVRTETARRLFLFSYYCHGISFIDMALLEERNIITYNNGRYIVYKRQKTKNQRSTPFIQINITDIIEELLKWFKENVKLKSSYITPIVSKEGYKGEQLYNHIHNRYKKYSEALKLLAKELEFKDINLTSYVARHTMAMTLQENNTPREIISQVLAHSELKTTSTYLDSFGSSIIDEAVKVL